MNKLYSFCLFGIILCCNRGVIDDFHSHDVSKRNKFFIRFNSVASKDGDSLILYVWDNFISSKKQMNLPHREYRCHFNNGTLAFEVDSLKNTVYFLIDDFSSRSIMPYYLAEPGDSINIDIQKDQSIPYLHALQFSGRGFEKYKCRYELILQQEDAYVYGASGVYSYNKKPVDSVNFIGNMDNIVHEQDKLENKLLSVLAKYENTLNKQIYNLLQADILGKIEHDKVYYFYYEVIPYFKENSQNISKEMQRKALDRMKRYYAKNLSKEIGKNISEEILSKSKNYLEYFELLNRVTTKLFEKNKTPYYTMKSLPAGPLRDRAITLELINYYEQIENADIVCSDAINNTLTDSLCKEILIPILANQKNGAKAYDFALIDVNGNVRHLSEFKGKVVFIDFWFSGCTACFKYFHNTVSLVENQFRNNKDMVFITVSIDADKQRWLESVKDGHYTSSEAINLYTGGEGYNSPIIKYYNVNGYPRPMLIDKKGNLFENLSETLKIKESLIARINSALKE